MGSRQAGVPPSDGPAVHPDGEIGAPGDTGRAQPPRLADLEHCRISGGWTAPGGEDYQAGLHLVSLAVGAVLSPHGPDPYGAAGAPYRPRLGVLPKDQVLRRAQQLAAELAVKPLLTPRYQRAIFTHALKRCSFRLTARATAQPGGDRD